MRMRLQGRTEKKETTEAKKHQHAPSWPSFEFETNKKDSTPPDF